MENPPNFLFIGNFCFSLVKLIAQSVISNLIVHYISYFNEFYYLSLLFFRCGTLKILSSETLQINEYISLSFFDYGYD